MGYNGKILRVNLSEKEVKEEDLDKDYVKDFLGGTGLAARYMLDLADSDVDPLSPENPLILELRTSRAFWTVVTWQVL